MEKQAKPLTKPLPLGRVVATPAALDLMAANRTNPHRLLLRHASGDWGCICKEDHAVNVRALKTDERVMSIYAVNKAGDKVWVITEADRSATTILLPSDC